jgi:hypothetical protein
MNFDPKRAAEIEIFTVDFAPLLPDGVVIAAAAWSISPVDGSDPLAASMIIGSASISGSLVSQLIGSGVPGLRYAPICTAQFSDGQTRVLPEYGQGLLEITL